jgi:hypothetical protein
MLTTAATARTERATIPPSQADENALNFEQAIREKGESKARWSQLMTLLEKGTP